MSNKKITELPIYQAPDDFIEMAVWTPPFVAHRVSIADNSYTDEETAIKRIKEIFQAGKVPLILPVKKND